jgi:shikimate dehydrogenase
MKTSKTLKTTTQKIKKAAVLGFPISHSLSPRIHNYWLKKYDILGEYLAVEVRPEELKTFLDSMPKNNFLGCNLTIPLKEKALEVMANVDPFAKFIGAVNTVIIKDGYFFGTNTDFVGFGRSLAEGIEKNGIKNYNFTDKTALVLGSGGAARAVVFSLLSLNLNKIMIANRDIARAGKIKENAISNFKISPEKIEVINWNEKEQYLKQIDLLINTTPLGMKGKEPLIINLKNLKKTAIVNDIVYNPIETNLLKEARERGLVAIDGLGMLLHQAAPAFEAWFNIKPEVNEELRTHVLRGLN